MSAVLILKFLHIAAMFTAVGVGTGTEIMAHRVAASRDTRAIRVFFNQVGSITIAMPVLYLSGLALGLLTAWVGVFDLRALWLVIAYVLFALTVTLHSTVGRMWFARMRALANAAPDGPASPELIEAGESRPARFLMWYTITVIVVFVFLMVLKPSF